MRAVITVQRHRSVPSSYLVGGPAVGVLENIPGVSEVRLESEGTHRATISYRWQDPGIHCAGIEAALVAHGMQLV
jgi:hypothetical protein